MVFFQIAGIPSAVLDYAENRWTDILRGSGDTLCAEETVIGFAKRFGCRVRTVEGAGNWFHTPEELEALGRWLRETTS